MKVPKSANLLSILFVLTAIAAQAQSSSNNEVVMYDPLFWKDELGIKNNQYRKIEEINNEFYESIRTMKVENRETNNSNLERGLQQRSQKIFNTLLPKQRRKLEKIIDKTAPIVAAP